MSHVRDFHLRYGHPAPPYPPLITDPDLVRFRLRLVKEEFKELEAELTALAHADDPVRVNELLQNVLKEVADLCYVAEGTAVAFGLPFEAAVEEVHRSNMSKDPPTAPNQKAKKGASYFKADMAKLIGIVEGVSDDLRSE